MKDTKYDKYVEWYKSNETFVKFEVNAFITLNRKRIRREIIRILYEYLEFTGVAKAINKGGDETDDFPISKDMPILDFLTNDYDSMYEGEKWYHPYDSTAKIFLMSSIIYKMVHHAVLNYMNKNFNHKLRWRDIEEISSRCGDFEDLEEDTIANNLNYYIQYLKVYKIEDMQLKTIISKGKKYSRLMETEVAAAGIVKHWYDLKGIKVSDEDIIPLWTPDHYYGSSIMIDTTLDDGRWFKVRHIKQNQFKLEVYERVERSSVGISTEVTYNM